jgi:hypothetical protein
MDSLESLPKIRRTGDERLHRDGQDLGTNLLDFWQWSASDLVSNATRGILAEYFVALALGIPTDGVREEWASFDLQTPTGIKVEVKSAAYVQSWRQTRLSRIQFVTPMTRAWSSVTNVQSTELKRQADVYVFALLAHQDKPTIDPLNVNQWQFYVLPTSALNARTRSQHSITLKSVCALCEVVPFEQLAAAIESAAAQTNESVVPKT